MYEERNNNSSAIRDLVLQLLFILLFVFILCWLFPTKSYLNQRLDGIGDSEYSAQLDALTSQIFQNNIIKMKEAAQEYFTLQRLPKNQGDTVKLTLGEMLDKKLLLPLTDKNNKACSTTKSYVEVAKDKEEYVMKVNLSCDNEEDYIIVHMGCYDYCSTTICAANTTTNKPTNNVIVNNPTKYKYVLTTAGKWGDYGSWSNWSTTKTTSTDSKQVETKVEKEIDYYDKKYGVTGTTTLYADMVKTCPQGYSDNGSGCYKVVFDSPTSSDTIYHSSKTCPQGYSDSGSDCRKVEYVGGGYSTVTASYITTCPSGYSETSDHTRCYKTTTVPGGNKIVYASYKGVCPQGYTDDGARCYKVNISKTSSYSYVNTIETTHTMSETGTYHYEFVSSRKGVSCDSSCKTVNYYTYKVYKVIISEKTSYDYKNYVNKTCPSGYHFTSDGKQCYKYEQQPSTTTTSYANLIKTCPSGYSENSSRTGCYKYVSNPGQQQYNIQPYTYSCPSGGNLSADKQLCVIESNSQASYHYEYSSYITTCQTGYSPVTGGNRCYKQESTYGYTSVPVYKNVTYYRYRTRVYTSGTTDVKWSTSKNDTKLLNAGYVLVG